MSDRKKCDEIDVKAAKKLLKQKQDELIAVADGTKKRIAILYFDEKEESMEITTSILGSSVETYMFENAQMCKKLKESVLSNNGKAFEESFKNNKEPKHISTNIVRQMKRRAGYHNGPTFDDNDKIKRKSVKEYSVQTCADVVKAFKDDNYVIPEGFIIDGEIKQYHDVEGKKYCSDKIYKSSGLRHLFEGLNADDKRLKSNKLGEN